MNLDTIVSYWVPRDLKVNSFEKLKVNLLILTLILGIILGFSMKIYTSVFNMYTEFPLLSLTICWAFILISFRFTSSIFLTGNLAVLSAFYIFSTISLKSGGIYSEDLHCMFILPLSAFILVGFRSGIFWMICSIIWSSYVYYISSSPEGIVYYKKQTVNFEPEYYYILCLFTIIFVSIVFSIFNYQHKSLLKKLSDQMLLERKNTIYEIERTALKTKQDALERANKKLEQYALVTSHDLKQPVRTILSFISLLKRNVSESDQEYISIIESSGQQMQNLINDLHDYSLVSNDLEKGFESLDLNEIVENVLISLTGSINEHKVKVTKEVLPTTLCLPTRINQLFQNLISNAIKFRKKDEQLAIHISAKDLFNFWEISISDNGIGIEKDYVSSIFDPFKKLNNSKEYKGSGIGLTTCRRIVELHQGKIKVLSTFGKGSTFIFTLKKNPDK